VVTEAPIVAYSFFAINNERVNAEHLQPGG
jgi:hypothetical protein